jgi:hypothetical protein
MYTDYDIKKGDILDAKILEAVQKSFIGAELVVNTPLMLDNQLNDLQDRMRGYTLQKVNLGIFPIIEYDEIPSLKEKIFSAPNFNLNMYLATDITNITTNKQDPFIERLDVYMDYKKVEDLAQTLHAI